MSGTSSMNFEKYIYDLRRIFRLNDFISNYDDFLAFAKKFQAVQKKAIAANKKIDDDELLCKLRSKVSLSEENAKKLEMPKEKNSRGVPVEMLKKFLVALFSYMDFKENEKVAKLKKLKESQENLPIFTYKDEILKSIGENRITIIAGDTGCGKSTQVPQYLMNAGYTCIACTQPRRLACISLSKRVAYETQNKFGEKIGYQIRFERRRQKDTVIVFLTEGLLLRQVTTDPHLSDYDVIVLDEIHERHLHGDFLLGILKCLILQREDLKVVLMSATINITLFSDYFGDMAHVIQVPGRLYPIKVNFSEVPAEVEKGKGKMNPEPYVRILQLIDTKFPSTERGDVLIFVSGFNEINTILDAINVYNEKAKKWIPLPLHSSLSIADQDKVFDYPPEGMRKCVISTNIAETSVTIDGIRFVIDSGMVKEMSYDSTCKMQRLKEFWVSKASAEQRKGRAGRTGPGVCYRLYTEADYNALADYTTPEIQRVPLDSLLLQMISMGLPDARKFPFIEAPVDESVEFTIYGLKQHGALTADEKLTTVGSLLSKLPVDIQIGKMLITGSMFHQIEPALSLAATLSVQSPMTNYAYRDADCEKMRSDLESDHGDPITFLNCFREWLEVKNSRDRGVSSRRWCKLRGLEEQRFYEMSKIRTQFKDLLVDSGLLKSDSHRAAMENMTSSERALRHGEVKLLKSLKRSANNDDGLERKKKYLKPDTWRIDNDDERGEHDVRDIDFRLKNTQSQLQSLISASTACSYTDLTILKLILANGLYPQVAVSDEFNHCKSTGEKLYHTQNKPYVFLHPTSYFGNHHDILQLTDADIVPHPKFNSRTPLSTNHQVLFYMSLLETNKPYLVNTMRMPAAESLLLFANHLHSNSDLSRVICDSWIELRFVDSQVGETVLCRMIKLRGMWERLMKSRIEDLSVGNLEDELTSLLIKTMNFRVLYSVRRLLPADLKTSYVGPGNNYYPGDNPFVKEFPLSPDDNVGGTRLSSYFTYDCLIDSPFVEDWECPHCELVAPLSALQKYQHIDAAHPKESLLVASTEGEQQIKPVASNSTSYYCEECQKTLIITPVEVLRHKKGHLK
uniref:Putative ATP-dependent RNA helicase DHX34 n=2 Tax=Lygus hesperus TaxID=30085 RepID=A0A0A9XYB6_LYGHE